MEIKSNSRESESEWELGIQFGIESIHASIAALAIQNEQRCALYGNNTSEFVEILLTLWKFFNVNFHLKHVRLNDPLFRPFSFNDERFYLLTRIIYWLEGWQCSLRRKES